MTSSITILFVLAKTISVGFERAYSSRQTRFYRPQAVEALTLVIRMRDCLVNSSVLGSAILAAKFGHSR